jgi:hypothetical protein
MSTWNDPRVYITAALIGLFGYAYIHNPADEAMKGALIAAFAAAYGYWIGASRGGSVAQEQAGAAVALAHDAMRSTGNADVGAIRAGDEVRVERA